MTIPKPSDNPFSNPFEQNIPSNSNRPHNKASPTKLSEEKIKELAKIALNEIKPEVVKRNLKKIARNQQKVVSQSIHPMNYIEDSRVAHSNNPVSQLKHQNYFNLATFQQIDRNVKRSVREAFIEIIKDIQDPLILERIEHTYNYIIKVYGTELNPETISKMTQYLLRRKYINNEVFIDKLIEEIKKNKSLSLENIPVYYKTHEIINFLRIQLQLSNHENKAILIDQIQQLNGLKEDYVSEDIVNHLKMIDIAALKRSLEPHLSSYDLHYTYPHSTRLHLILEQLNPSSESYAIKLGVENQRELLAFKILQHLEMDEFILPKTSISLPHYKIDGSSSEDSIASEWISNSQPYPRQEFKNYFESKKQVAQIGFKWKVSRSKPETLQQELKIAEEELNLSRKALLQVGGIRSAQHHALIGLLLCPYDSHAKQYIMQEGEFKDCDLGRFLAPGEALIYKDITYSTLCSTFLDHPAIEEPIPQDLINKIKAWNMDEIESFFQQEGVFASEEDFEHARSTLVAIHKDLLMLENPTPSQKNLTLLAHHYAVDLTSDIDQTIQELKDKIQNACKELKGQPQSRQAIKQLLEMENHLLALTQNPSLNKLSMMANKYSLQLPQNWGESLKILEAKLLEEEQKITLNIFKKIHPNAFKEFEDRLIKLQKYVNSSEHPTLKGAYEKVYPHLMPFIKIMERLDTNPSVTHSVGFDLKRKIFDIRALEDIILFAQQTKLATKNELKEMMSALKELRGRNISHHDLPLTMDFEI